MHKLDRFDVRFIKWDEVETRKWGTVLFNIPVGGHIRSLPYADIPNATCMHIPVETPYDPFSTLPPPPITIVKYQKVRLLHKDGTFIWRRVE